MAAVGVPRPSGVPACQAGHCRYKAVAPNRGLAASGDNAEYAELALFWIYLAQRIAALILLHEQPCPRDLRCIEDHPARVVRAKAALRIHCLLGYGFGESSRRRRDYLEACLASRTDPPQRIGNQATPSRICPPEATALTGRSTDD